MSKVSIKNTDSVSGLLVNSLEDKVDKSSVATYYQVGWIDYTITITTNKTLISNKTLTGEEKNKLICYIQAMKRLPCLLCSVNITFIKNKRGIRV